MTGVNVEEEVQFCQHPGQKYHYNIHNNKGAKRLFQMSIRQSYAATRDRSLANQRKNSLWNDQFQENHVKLLKCQWIDCEDLIELEVNLYPMMSSTKRSSSGYTSYCADRRTIWSLIRKQTEVSSIQHLRGVGMIDVIHFFEDKSESFGSTVPMMNKTSIRPLVVCLSGYGSH